MNAYPFNGSGNWYKGNLHCHSTVSDGALTPQEVADLYRKNGWNFLALTEHNIYTDWQEFNREDFIIIPGVEVSVDEKERPRCYHLVGLSDGTKSLPNKESIRGYEWNGPSSVQDTIDKLNEKGLYVVLCHPIWSRTEFEDFKDFGGYFGIEIYNHGCEMENHTGFSTVYWDSLLRRKRRVWGLATDDAHHKIKDHLGGWVMVKSESLTRSSIISALLDGRFYSSIGPSIYDFGVEDDEVFIECSEVKAIHFVTYETLGWSHYAGDNNLLTSSRFKLKGKELYVRVECIDEYGRVAWTNPIFLK